MSFSKGLLQESFLQDCVNHTNFVLFVVLRECICSIFINDGVDDDSAHLFNSERKVNCGNPFELVFLSSKVPKFLQALVRGRFERLRNYYEAMTYTHLSSFRECFYNISCREIDSDFQVTRNSVFGLLLRKFAAGFHCQSFSQVVMFLDDFFEAYDTSIPNAQNTETIISDFAFSFSRDKYLISTRENALYVATCVLDAVGKLGGRPCVNLKKYVDLLSAAQELYPGLPYLHYASHIFALKQHNLTKAENELHAYFETSMAFKSAEFDFNNTCAYMAVTAAAMHFSFGHWHKGECLEKEALQKALESEFKDPLRHVKIIHTLLHTSTEPLRYDDHVPTTKHLVSNNLLLAEFRTKFWSMLDSGACPNQLLNHYFNSPVAALQAYFTTCLLDLSTMWLFYGYSNLSTVLLMCAINADCLQPCAFSDSILAIGFANLVREFSSNGSIEIALKLSKSCQSIISRFPEKSNLHQASLEIELEQNLRSRYDLSHCDHLVNAIKLCCPWEAALRQADVEYKRGNLSLSHDLLRHIIDSCIARRDNKLFTLQGYEKKMKEIKPFVRTNGTEEECALFSHISLPTFDDHVPVGGIARLAQVELRAHLALVEILISINNTAYATLELDTAIKICEQFKLDLGKKIGSLIYQVLSLHSGTISNAAQSFQEMNLSLLNILHRTDRTTRFRCQTFVSRIRLHTIGGNNPESKFLKSHMNQLLLALAHYRKLDDRKRILDILYLVATALHAMNKCKERNEISRMCRILREQFTIPNSGKIKIVDIF